MGIKAVQVTGGLVCKEHLRVIDQSPGDGHSLLLASGQLSGVGLVLGRQPDQPEHLRHCFPDYPGRHPDYPLGKCNILKHSAVLQESEILKDHA